MIQEEILDVDTIKDEQEDDVRDAAEILDQLTVDIYCFLVSFSSGYHFAEVTNIGVKEQYCGILDGFVNIFEYITYTTHAPHTTPGVGLRTAERRRG